MKDECCYFRLLTVCHESSENLNFEFSTHDLDRDTVRLTTQAFTYTVLQFTLLLYSIQIRTISQ